MVLAAFATYLSGEADDSPFTTRHSQSDDALLAGDWVGEQFESYGFNMTREQFRLDYCTNVIAEIPGAEEPDSIVILGAHLDDREANILNVTGRAPVRSRIGCCAICAPSEWCFCPFRERTMTARAARCCCWPPRRSTRVAFASVARCASVRHTLRPSLRLPGACRVLMPTRAGSGVLR